MGSLAGRKQTHGPNATKVPAPVSEAVEWDLKYKKMENRIKVRGAR